MKKSCQSDDAGGEPLFIDRPSMNRSPASPIFQRGVSSEQLSLEILQAYDAFGGALSGDEAALHLRGRTDQPLSLLATWITRRQLVTITCRTQTFIPVFQFDFPTIAPRVDVHVVVAELAQAFDDLEVARWFVRPHRGLFDVQPVAILDRDPASVMHAARCDKVAALNRREF